MIQMEVIIVATDQTMYWGLGLLDSVIQNFDVPCAQFF
jgi:hypothetical protein